MAAESLGAPFFRYKFREVATINPSTNEVVWVNTRYTPIDLRSTAPVARRKFLVSAQRHIPVSNTWKHNIEPATQLFSRDKEELRLLPESHAVRCEEWSTLRQMLPSRGHLQAPDTPRWGTGPPPRNLHFKRSPALRFPHINSAMTGYIDDMHVNHRNMFRLY